MQFNNSHWAKAKPSAIYEERRKEITIPDTFIFQSQNLHIYYFLKKNIEIEQIFERNITILPDL